MAAYGETMMCHQLSEQADEVLALDVVDSSTDVGFVDLGDFEDLAQYGAAVWCEAEGVCPPVVRISATHEQPTLLEPVDQCHDAARWHAKSWLK